MKDVKIVLYNFQLTLSQKQKQKNNSLFLENLNPELYLSFFQK